MRIRKAIKLLTILVAVFAFGSLGTSWWSGSARAEVSDKLQSQNTSRQRLRDGSNCTTGGGLNSNANTDASGSANTGNGNRHRGGNGNGGSSGNNSGVNKSKGKGGSK
ncbi:MAG: hypothetical protein JW984_11340 [Deltaproteobacteria bacterium]|uniref:Uncharacterized protein n=1 Tax=Candidatus Zymogenus saltonus TaxID=2844893 RepID=A0A9D8KGJ9_9DELT|nr:hypothetical protein [Candidatus Zymogenus saltonus]